MNLGRQSPSLHYSEKEDADTILEILTTHGFFKNGIPVAVHSQKDLDASFQAAKARIFYTPTGFRISATAPARSCLLLPLTFSHCLEFIPKQGEQHPGEPRLYRANLAQTLLVFDQKLEGEVRYFSSPFYNPLAVWKDVMDGKRILGKAHYP